MQLGGFVTAFVLDSHNWSALHHAVDAASYSVRAFEAALALINITGVDIINAKTTGSQPKGHSCLHLLCDGSDRQFLRHVLVQALLRKRAELEARTSKNNTPFLIASGTCVTEVTKVLMAAGADVSATNER